jgi:hypothetical protein
MATKIHYKELSGNKKKKDVGLIINNSKGLEINRKVITFRYTKCAVLYLKGFQSIGQRTGNNGAVLRETT